MTVARGYGDQKLKTRRWENRCFMSILRPRGVRGEATLRPERGYLNRLAGKMLVDERSKECHCVTNCFSRSVTGFH